MDDIFTGRGGIVNYDKQASDFLAKYGMVCMTCRDENQSAPDWAEKNENYGVKCCVTLEAKDRKVVFPFWGCVADKQTGKLPSLYSILACISGDCNCPETFDDFCSEYGYDTDSRRAYATWERCLAFSKELRAFFTEEEIEALQEIQ